MAKRIRGVGSPAYRPRKATAGVNESMHPPESGQRRSGQHTPGTTEFPQGTASGYGRKLFRRVDIDLSSARNNPERLGIAGTVIWVANASSVSALVDVRLDLRQNDPIPFLPGTVISGIPFQDLWIENDAQSGGFITLMVAQDSPEDRIGVET